MNIGLIAHDSKKKLMQNFCIAYRGILCKNELYATGTTGRLIEEVTNLNVHKYLAGHLGGAQQLGAQIEHNEIDLVIFLRDPLTPKSHEPDVNNVVKICDIPLSGVSCVFYERNFNMKRLLSVLCITGLLLGSITGCGKEEVTLEQPYDIYETTGSLGLGTTVSAGAQEYFSKDLCVADDVSLGTDTTDSQVAEGAGTFNLATNEIVYAKNIYERLYPASTTKILTAYIALKYCTDLSQTVTISENAANQASDSSVCGLHAGDVIRMDDLLYGMMLRSGNDAAIAIAESISGSVEEFAALMNKEAAALGATQSHFVNPNGLPDENHYTSVYDLYLIFRAALQNETFVQIISTTSYDVTYQAGDGTIEEHTWENTNQYLSGHAKSPDGFTVIGGKTGTTGDAGYCLVLYSMNEQSQPIISIVLKADGKSNLYLLMNEMLSGFAN